MKKILHAIRMISKYTLIGFVFQLAFLNLLHAGPSKAQGNLDMEKVTVNVKATAAPLPSVLESIKSQTDFVFIYDDKIIPSNTEISIEARNEPLENVLLTLSKEHRWAFKQVNDRISIKPIKGLHLGKIVIREVTVSGTVMDANNQPIPGVTVLVKGTTNGTTTDLDGRYRMNVPENSVLVFSFVGFVSQEVAVGNKDVIDVQLEEKISALNEVVVVGYGEQKKINLTGAVNQVGSEVTENRPAPNLTRMLQGTLPNLNIKMVDGSPTRSAAFNIRGMTSIGAGGDALVLIDGVEGDPNLVNPNDVESVTILKDASSAAVYGSRAAFGVVLITTKSAKAGKSQLNVNLNHSVNKRTVVPDLVNNGYQWAKNFDEAFYGWYDYKTHPISVNSTFPFSLEYLDRLRQHDEDPSLPKVEYVEEVGRYEYYGNTDWFKYHHKDNMPATEASISASGGNENARYFISGMYYHQDGIFNYSSDKFDKYNLRAKGEVNLNDWLVLENNFDLSTYTYGYPLLANGDINIWRYLAVQSYPMLLMNNPDGTYSQNGVYVGASFLEGNSRSDQSNFFVRNTPTLTATPFGDLLTLKANFTFSKKFIKDKRVNNYVNYSNAPGDLNRFGNSLLRQYEDETTYWGSNITAQFNKTLNEEHDLGLLLGYNIESSLTENWNTSRDGLLVPGKPDYNLLDGLNYTIRGGGSEWKYLGAFYRLNYSYKDKYLLEFNGRYDGSSKFPSDERYGFFPSVSAGWNVSEEGFMQNTRNWLANLKIRSSYGSLGNGNVAPYRYLETMSVNKSSVMLEGIQKGYTSLPGVIPAGLTWERATTFNIGVDASFLDGRLGVNYDWYNRMTTDMFTYGQPLPNVFGATEPYGNYADLSTKGWEFTLTWKDQAIVGGKPFTYGFNGSLWDNRSTITKFNNPEKVLGSGYYVGQNVGEIWGYVTEGLFTSEEEVLNHADQDFLRNSNGNIWLPGDIKFADLNDDGVINQGDNTVNNPGDRKVIGNNTPRYQFGFTLNANWNNFGISAFFQGIAKRDWYFAPEADLFWGIYNRPYSFQPTKMMNDYWTEENPDAYFPRLRGYTALGTGRSLGAPQTRYLQDASYIRLKNITVDYTLPTQWVNKIGMQRAKIFFTGQNIWTRTGLSKHTDNFDPEIIENPLGDMTNGYGQGDAYPMLKSYTLGVNLSF
ncbi:SusC/RagA family TonB-linked outer membrane protein [Echinicola vietnamensis]|uniref:TonB-linked outer membrane protein, SusC/RagA family n=1 Tax=Echinicola vietnamensis (strain DSM 17526 / LMG 23754 / KMM 6221) TaxID=926556 RepID=L0FY35_ECHVK|nr:TonB-dependent receptor [Echinicola vietnamensis]AGA78829.1 TonB-linked outer membrane protein, SusC/RagA family [Echinicola vietnamensis DSM 17526]